MASRKERLSSKPISLVMKRSDFSCSCFIGFDSSSCTPRDGPKWWLLPWKKLAEIGQWVRQIYAAAELADKGRMIKSL
jgi:hypothetical protein